MCGAGHQPAPDIKPEQRGLIELLEANEPLDAQQFDGDRKLCIIPLRPVEGANQEELLTGEGFVRLLDELGHHFDQIVLDLPPILPVASAPVIASRADAVVFVARWRKTSSFAIKAALKRLPDDLVNVVGVALNQVDLRKKGYFDKHDATYYYDHYREYHA